MRRHEISDADWGRVQDLLPTRGPNPADRGFVNAVLYVAKTGVPWRDLPDRFGNWNSVWRRVAPGAQAGGGGGGVAARPGPGGAPPGLRSTLRPGPPAAPRARK